MKEICKTDRLVLREFIPSDVEPLKDVLGNADVMRFSLYGPWPRDQIAKWVDRRIEAFAKGLPSMYAVIGRVDSRLLGFCGLAPYEDPDEEVQYEAGYRYRPDCWNQGYATEALRASMAYIFSHFNMPAVAAVVEEENAASIRVLEKAGFKYMKDTIYHNIPVKKYLIRKNNGY